MRQGAGINYLAHSDAPASGEKSRRVATNGASGRLGVCQGGAIMRAAHAEHKDNVATNPNNAGYGTHGGAAAT